MHSTAAAVRSAWAGGTRKIAAPSIARKARKRLPPPRTAWRIAAPSVVSGEGRKPSSAASVRVACWLRTAWNCSVSASMSGDVDGPGAEAAVRPLGDLGHPLLCRLELFLAVGAEGGAAG